MPPETLTPGGDWAPRAERPTVLLLDTPGQPDRGVVEDWLSTQPAATLRVARGAEEAVRLAGVDDALIAPVRVAWLPPGIDGDRRWRPRDLLTLRGGAAPSVRERERILAEEPDRCRVLIGEPAPLSALRSRMPSQAAGGLAKWVEDQARLTLDRSERLLTGSRYKLPRDVKAQLIGDPGFARGLGALARKLDRPPADVRAQALGYLEEMAGTQSPIVRELWARWARLMYSRAYELSFDADALERLRELGAKHPLVFLPTHKSNLDGYVMTSLLNEQGFPPNHLLGGINMAFWPIGPIGRRVGVIWIRRTIREDPVYRWVLRQYLAHLVRRRFNLEWYIEGGRTRTGKLLPPKMGLLRYLVDAIEDAGIEDVRLVPVSIVYDHLDEVADMTAESRGAVKSAEGIRWLVGYARRLNRPSGRIQVRFGEPLDVAQRLTAHGAAEDPRLALAKLSFDICTRINRVTPLTRTGLVTLAMLGLDGRSVTAAEACQVLEPFQRYARARSLPGAAETEPLISPAGIQPTLATLVEHRIVDCFNGGPEPVYAIGRENELVAAFYRNSVIHWFVNRAISELALVRAAEDDSGRDSIEVAWSEAFRVRDTLKFEFFFAGQDGFRAEMREELALIDPSWTSTGAVTLRDLGVALLQSGGLVAHRVLRSFLEAYHVVAERLESLPAVEPVDRAKLIDDCLGLGEQMRRRHQITSGEAVSKELFSTAMKLADNRGLLDAAKAGERAAFAAELRDLVRRVHVLAELDHSPSLAEPLLAVAGGA
ncbi:MAG TPA: glycerol-3-phosphate 1-O-acyltransferase [Thermoleophilaceae bacterium]|nr:glycerol-3-phosphate 1-O-acyltransferase [Thermoleophilaceae bacterium]